MTITLTLTPDQQAWVAAHVATGDFSSTEDAVRHLLAQGIADYDRDLTHDALMWAKPYVDEALAEIERGEVVTLEEVEAHLDARFGPLAD